MPVIDENGRVFHLLNVVDLLVVLLTVAVAAAVSALLLPGSIAVIVVAGLGATSMAGLVFLSRRRYDVAWSEVRSAMKPDLSVPTLGGIKRWFTAEPDPEVVVIDLRETITVGPFIVVLDRIVAVVAGAYRDSWLDSLAGCVRRGFLGKSWVRVRESRLGRGIAAALAPPDPPEDSGTTERSPSRSDQTDGVTTNGSSLRSMDDEDPVARCENESSGDTDSGDHQDTTRKSTAR